MNYSNPLPESRQVNIPIHQKLYFDILAYPPHSVEGLEFPYIHGDIMRVLEASGWHFFGHETPEQIDDILRSYGYDPVQLVKDMRVKIDALIAEYGGAE